MDQLPVFEAGATDSTGVVFCLGLAIQVLGKGEGNTKFSVAGRPNQQHGMGHTVLQRQLNEQLFGRTLPDDIFELHGSK